MSPEKRAHAMRIIETLRGLGAEERRRVLEALPEAVAAAVAEEWWWQARGGQQEPEACEDGSPWRVWTIMAGRGFGKTRAGAEWVSQRAREEPEARIALVAGSLDEVAKVMVEGESGILSVARTGEEPRWISSRGVLQFQSGARAFSYGAERPDVLRGPQHHFAWCDELAKWPRAEALWDNLMLGLRLGERPRTVVTTTPRQGPLLERLLALPRGVTTHGRTDDNPDSAPDFRSAMRELYGGTRLARQELDGLLLEDLPGALWTREMLEKGRKKGDACRQLSLERIVVGVDPPAGTQGDECGIVVCGIDEEDTAWVLADLSAGGLRPEAWAGRVAAAAEAWEASRVVAEKNQGGDMVEAVLRAADSALPVKLVSATASKPARAEPVALRFESDRARLGGSFPELEDQLCAMTHKGYEGRGSPDRADAMIWAMSELLRPNAEPRLRRL